MSLLNYDKLLFYACGAADDVIIYHIIDMHYHNSSPVSLI